MEKVIVTQEQGRAFEAIANGYEKDSIMDGVGFVWHEELEPLNDLRPSEIARALYVGYEVELDIKEGDYVVNENGTIGIVKEIKKVRYGGLLTGRWLTGTKSVMSCPISFIERLATDEEIIFAKKGRVVWELRERDILSDKITGAIHEIKNQINNVTYFKSQVSGLNLDATKKRYQVACFAEDRQDV